jgi:hypothetical protein
VARAWWTAGLALAGVGCTSPATKATLEAGREGRAHDGAGEDSGASTETEPDDTAPPDDSPDSGEPPDSGDPPDTGTPAPPPPLQGLLVAQNWEQRSHPLGPSAGQLRVVFLQEAMHADLPELRAANPEALLLAYQKVGGMRADGGDHASTGVRLDQAEDHEDWFLHDAAGNRLEYCDYDGVWAANIGSPGYQQAWLQAVEERLLRDGFDGVMMDDVNTFPGHCLGERGTNIAEYPTDEAYGDAVVDFMLAVGPGLKSAGLAVSPNIAMNPWDAVQRAQAEAMLPAVTHWGREYWMKWDDSANFRGDEWASTLDLMVHAQSVGVGFFALTKGPGEEGEAAAKTYGRASFLLAWDGESDSAWGYLDVTHHDDTWSDDQLPALGRPRGPAQALGAGWIRDYDNGLVVVNPATEGSLSLDLDAPLLDADGTPVDALVLAPGTAALLQSPE